MVVPYTLPPIRRVVTQTDPKTGDSHVLFDETEESKGRDSTNGPPSENKTRVIWAAKGADVTTDGSDGTILLTSLPGASVVPGGSNLTVFDTAPGAKTPMHRSLSLDYFIVISGSVDLELSSGEIVTLKTGDMGAQQACWHQWHNKSETEWARVAYVICSATPPNTLEDGSPLPDRGELVP
ncbi:hypothetical protein FB451DRAFT_1557622 [Mycena latifolia]|nr:hypothetical protein FB451DRAFT_1557622 [Mycena latifolia]